jgi:hypothetical protein
MNLTYFFTHPEINQKKGNLPDLTATLNNTFLVLNNTFFFLNKTSMQQCDTKITTIVGASVGTVMFVLCIIILAIVACKFKLKKRSGPWIDVVPAMVRGRREEGQPPREQIQLNDLYGTYYTGPESNIVTDNNALYGT